MNIKENTKIIAEFMGIVCNENEYYNNGHKIGSILNFYSSKIGYPLFQVISDL